MPLIITEISLHLHDLLPSTFIERYGNWRRTCMRVCVACELEYSDYLTIGHKDKALVKFLVNNDLIIVVNSN